MTLFFSVLPGVLAALIIVLAGWYLGSLLARLVARLLSGAQFARLRATQPLGLLQDPAHLLALAAKWVVRLIALFVAVDVLGLPAATELVRRVLLWLPQLAVGIAVLVIGGYLANAAAALAAGAARSARLRNPGLVSLVAQVAVWAFAAIIALHEVGVGDELVYTLFAGVVTLAAVVGGLALGLGGQDIAAGLVAQWYSASRGAVSKIAAATDERKQRREFELETLARRWKEMGLPAGPRLRASQKRVDQGPIPEDDVFKGLTVEAAQMGQEVVITKHARVVDELRVRVEVFEHEERLQTTVRDIEAHIERFRAPSHERRKGNGSYSGIERRRGI